jgi:hypothetical protein
MVEGMRHTPRWAELEALAPTLAYDSEVMGDTGRDGTIPVEKASRVTVPALVLTGGADYPWMIEVGRRLADAMPNGRTVSWRARSTPCPPRCSCRCWRISFRTAQGRESEPSSKPLFTGVLRRGVPELRRGRVTACPLLLKKPSGHPNWDVEYPHVAW